MRSLFKSVIVALASLGFAVSSSAQSPILVKSVNYGNGATVTESQGNGAPASTCTGLARYTQLDAAAGSNVWECISGTMVQQVGQSVTCNSMSGGNCNFVNPVVAPSMQAGTTTTGNTFKIQALSTIPNSWTFDSTSPRTALQSVEPGLNLASQYQTTPTSNDGIANCFLTNTTCYAGPGYGITDVPLTFTGTHAQNPTQSRLIDDRNGSHAEFIHNPPGSLFVGGGYRDPWEQVLVNDTTQGAYTGSGNVSANVYGINQWLYYSAPGLDLGNSGLGGCCWHTQQGHSMSMQVNSPGISIGLTANVNKAGIGDNVAIQGIDTNYGGAIAPSDEGNEPLRLVGGSAATQLAGTTSSVATGATKVTVACTQDCNPGDGRFLITTQTPISTGNVTATAAPSGNTPGTYTVDATVTPSTAWATLNGNCVPAISAPVGVAGTSITCNVSMLSGTFAQGDLIAFGGSYHEWAIVTAATSTSFTASLRHVHGSGSWVMANGPVGFIDFSINDITANTLLNFPHDIIGATDSHTLCYAWFSSSGATTAGTTGRMAMATYNTFGNITNNGGIVTLTASGVSPNQTAIFYNGATITIAGAANSAYNGPCTNTTLGSGFNSPINCTQSASNGQASTTGGTIVLGTTGYGNTAYKLWQGAEVIDVNTYSLTLALTAAATASGGNTVYTGTITGGGSNALVGTNVSVNGFTNAGNNGVFNVVASSTTTLTLANSGGIAETTSATAWGNLGTVCPGNVCSFTVEPNNVAWGTGSAIQPQHYNWHGKQINSAQDLYNPFSSADGINFSFLGPGVSGGLSTSFTSYAVATFANLNPTNMYAYHGGLVGPPGGIQFPSGLFNYYLSAANAPEGPGSSAIYIGCPVAGCNADWAFNYNILSLNSVFTMNWHPALSQMVISGNILFGSNQAKMTFNDTLGAAALAAPAAPTVTPNTVGGGIAASTQRCYTVAMLNGPGSTQMGAEICKTTGSGTSTNSFLIQIPFVQGAEGYLICEGATPGSELQALIVGNGIFNNEIVTWTDTGVTASGACPTTNNTLPGLDPWAYLNLQNQASGFASKLLPTTLTANRTVTLPDASGTVAYLGSPAFTGTPTAPTPATSDNSTTVATTAYVKANLPTKYTPSLTPAATAASTCAEQTFTVTGLATGQAVLSANPPSALSHVWIGSKRVSATNTLAIQFCGDATGGTAASGTWVVTAF